MLRDRSLTGKRYRFCQKKFSQEEIRVLPKYINLAKKKWEFCQENIRVLSQDKSLTKKR